MISISHSALSCSLTTNKALKSGKKEAPAAQDLEGESCRVHLQLCDEGDKEKQGQEAGQHQPVSESRSCQPKENGTI